MKVILNKRATNAIRKVIRWIDKQNTPGAGGRWFENFAKEIEHLAEIKAQHAICKGSSLARHKYRCLTPQDKWVGAYKSEQEQFVVYRFIYGLWLDY